jgi:hypothetical protein
MTLDELLKGATALGCVHSTSTGYPVPILFLGRKSNVQCWGSTVFFTFKS